MTKSTPYQPLYDGVHAITLEEHLSFCIDELQAYFTFCHDENQTLEWPTKVRYRLMALLECIDGSIQSNLSPEIRLALRQIVRAQLDMIEGLDYARDVFFFQILIVAAAVIIGCMPLFLIVNVPMFISVVTLFVLLIGSEISFLANGSHFDAAQKTLQSAPPLPSPYATFFGKSGALSVELERYESKQPIGFYKAEA